MAALGLPCCTWAFSSCLEQRPFCCGERASHFSGLSCCGEALLFQSVFLFFSGLRRVGSVLWPTGIVAPWHVGSSPTRDGTPVPCIGRQILFIFKYFLKLFFFLSNYESMTTHLQETWKIQSKLHIIWQADS